MSKVLTDNKHYTDIAAAIREKNGTDDKYKPAEMADAIAAIETGGGGGGDLPEEAFNITGDCENRFFRNGWNWFINKYGNKIQTSDITNLRATFQGTTALENIPFEINCENKDGGIDLRNFMNACYVKELPKINNCKPNSLEGAFRQMKGIRYFPDDMADWFDWSHLENLTNGYSGSMAQTFAYCESLRRYPIKMLEHSNPSAVYSYSVYYQMANGCLCLDEIKDIPVKYQTSYALTSNGFSSSFSFTQRLKELTFKTNEDGTPFSARWKKQTIDLKTDVGYGDDVLKTLNSGITADKEVTDDATYQALKNDTDWFSTQVAYSRYNRTSAVNTINSLPDTSAYLATAGGTNTITFLGASGSLTDGGAINTMTEEEIAVAAAKGWTVAIANY